VGARGPRGGVALLGIAIVAAVAGCSSAPGAPPSKLVDGSRAEAPAIHLDAPDPQVLTKVASIDASDAAVGTAAGACLRATRPHEATSPLVVRTGVSGLSATFRTAAGRALVACDGSHAIPTRSGPWCGRAVGRLEGGRLLDPRLELAGCTTPGGGRIAFAWFTPGRDATYVAVRQTGYTEVYPVVGKMPVRVTTGAVVDDRSGARFEISEHAASGAVLRSSTLEARVAG